MSNWSTIYIWAAFWIILFGIWYLQHRAKQKRIQRRRERFKKLCDDGPVTAKDAITFIREK